MTISSLENTSLDVIIDCFLKAFESYFVQMPTDRNYYKKRWAEANVAFDCSFGIFDDEQLVGFILNVVDDRFGSKTAYNAGTGVIPEYRGQYIVKQLYEYAIPKLKTKGVQRALLEVITENIAAIKAYESVGFYSCKTYKCFKGKITTSEAPFVQLKRCVFDLIPWDRLPNLATYSWDNQRQSIPETDNDYYEVLSEEKPLGYFIINATKDYVFQLDVFENSEAAWQGLFQGIQQLTTTIRINNIDAALTQKTTAIETAGLQNHVNQFEMQLTF